MQFSLKPLLAFKTIEEFVFRHKAGTQAEFTASQKLVDEINREDNKFKAWVISKTRQTPKRSEYLVVVQPGPDGERKIPQQGEPAKVRIIFDDDSSTRFWDASRIENPMALLNITAHSAKQLAAYKVTAHIADAHDGITPLIDADTAEPADGGIMLTADNAVHANFLLSASEATKNAELNALEQLCGRYINTSERQRHAFNYFVTLRNPEFFVDLHEEIPHLTTAMQHPSWPGSPLAKKFNLLNPQQKAAYMHGFRKLECGICILPGGPGAGKTHFNLFTIAMAQSQQLPRPVMVGGHLKRRCPKVLFIVDMNCPVDDVANRMTALYNELGMKKSIIRMKGWGAEVKSSDRLNAAEDAASGEGMPVDFTNQFLQTVGLMSVHRQPRSCQAPGLDEAAWQRYDEHKHTRYEELTQYLSGELWEQSDIVPFRLRTLIYKLYRDTLAATDFIATTPVAASNHFNGMFKPDLVYFDEAPHARELTNLIAIANFDPIAWIFCGDHRQTIPYVGSATPGCDNIYREQMQVSMMERAAAANAIRYELLMNHRSFGGLHQLASTMWYGGRMVSGNAGTPAALTHMQKRLSRFMDGRTCTVPRLLVHLKNCGPEGRDGTSAWNPTHTAWVMAQVLDLLNDTQFKHAERNEPGTILIISPYKKAFNEYKNEVKKLPQWAQKRVETRTVDVVQGHEADFVFLDLVKNKSTKFLDNPNRLCVAVTRARLGEIIMMHPDMVQSATFKTNSRNLRQMYDICQKAGQVVHVDPATSPTIRNRTVTTDDPIRITPARVGLSDPPRSEAARSPRGELGRSRHAPQSSTNSAPPKRPGSGLSESTRAELAKSMHARPASTNSDSPSPRRPGSGLSESTRAELAKSIHAPANRKIRDARVGTVGKLTPMGRVSVGEVRNLARDFEEKVSIGGAKSGA
ncbi:P-loop containing nucleoside triphosphate hydrolase protein [Chaetomium sp. MPI-CAGE-AT-0009]|nr:P-loop containing nucleoside triphosphate hydrolase protein [Chaetomium sp. MPI-CAGE-AT-0009]